MKLCMYIEINVSFLYIEKLKNLALLHLYYNLVNIAYYGKNFIKSVLPPVLTLPINAYKFLSNDVTNYVKI